MKPDELALIGHIKIKYKEIFGDELTNERISDTAFDILEEQRRNWLTTYIKALPDGFVKLCAYAPFEDGEEDEEDGNETTS